MISEMLLIIGRELRYYRVLYALALTAAVGFGLFLSLTSAYRSFIETGTLIQIVLIISMAVNTGMDKRERMLMLRPVSKRALAWSSGYYVILTSFVLLALWIIFATFATEDPPMHFNLQLVLVLVFRTLANTVVFFLFGIGFELVERYMLLGFVLITFFGFVVGYGATAFWDLLLAPSFLSAANEALIPIYLQLNAVFLILVVLLYSLDAMILYRRKSFIG
jgi:hypothetical protein